VHQKSINNQMSVNSFTLRTWQKGHGTIIALLSVAAVEILQRSGLTVYDPVSIYLLAVAYAAYVGGVRQGSFAAAVALIYTAWFYKAHGVIPDDGSYHVHRLLLAIAVTVLGVVLATGLRRRVSGLLSRVKAAIHALHREQAVILSIINHAADGIVLLDRRKRVELLNPAAAALFGYNSTELIGQPIDLIVPAAREVDVEGGIAIPVDGLTRTMGGWRKDGLAVPLEVTISRMVVEGDHKYTAILRDVTARKNAEDEIRQLAERDFLTGLPNRLLLRDRLAQALAMAGRHSVRVAVMFIDLDGFKQINDTYGHHAGDRLLQLVAQRMENCVRTADTVSRTGGDEFVVLLPEIHDTEDARQVAAKLHTMIAEPYDVNGERLTVSVSIGIGVYPDDGITADAVLQAADQAMYDAKRSPHPYRFQRDEFNPDSSCSAPPG
jgi:diguanylate cyclase (GGDEF)-like protein/PAS domain S-box-containing protein